MSSTQQTTEAAKGKEQQTDRAAKVDGQSLRVSQLKVDDGHIGRLKFPSKNGSQDSTRVPEILPQIKIDGFSSVSQSKQSTAKKPEAQEDQDS